MTKTIIIITLVLLTATTAYAWKSARTVTIKRAVSSTPSAKPEDAINQRKAELNGSQWTIELVPASGRGRAERDVITFSEGKVSSVNLENRGFVSVGYSARLKEDGTFIWEAMQTSEKEGQAFWRGDIRGNVMHGVLCIRNKKNRGQDFKFTSVAK